MNRLRNLFGRKSNNLLAVYFTAGHPAPDTVVPIIEALADGGADIVEVGVPFSDPMADGPTIQQSSSVALRGGMTLARLLDEVEQAREKCPDTPIVLMGYLNPMMQYGIERLFEQCARIGVDGLIIPDLPFDEYLAEYKPLCVRYGIDIIMLITPETSEERIRLIDENCDGFIYMVSTASTTGAQKTFPPETESYFSRTAGLGLSHPRLIGFGISNSGTYAAACRYSSGGIVGSHFIRCLEAEETLAKAVARLMTDLGIH